MHTLVFYVQGQRGTFVTALTKLKQGTTPIGKFIDEHARLWNLVNPLLSEDHMMRDLRDRVEGPDRVTLELYLALHDVAGQPFNYLLITEHLIQKARIKPTKERLNTKKL
jgi:hypothetical protein